MKNTRKKTGSFVWHNDEIKLITNQNVGAFHIVLNNRDKVIRNHVKLVKVGDELEFNDLSDDQNLSAICSRVKYLSTYC